MALGRTNASVGGSASGLSSIIVLAPTGSTVYITNQEALRKDATEDAGTWTFNNCDLGTWTVHASLGTSTATKDVVIQEEGQLFRYYVTIGYQVYASDFDWGSFGTYGIDYEVVYDDDTPIPQELWSTTPNWKARLLTTNGLTPLVDGEIDIFMTGGGGGHGATGSSGNYLGGAGGGGYTLTELNVSIVSGETYDIVIGAGGEQATDGGNTSAFGKTAEGGKTGLTGGTGKKGGDGGSGGGPSIGAGYKSNGGKGGTDGSDGKTVSYKASTGTTYTFIGGTGQGTTTREFGAAGGRLYANGGSGLYTDPVGEPNSGDGSRLTDDTGKAGIVVIRNAREVA